MFVLKLFSFWLLEFLSVFSLTKSLNLYTNEVSIIDCLSVVEKIGCPNDKISYWLFNDKVNGYHLDVKNASSIQNAPFHPNVKTVFLLNGYNGTRDDYINAPIRPEYIKLGYNVISSNYYELIPHPCYVQAVQNADLIAQCYTDFFRMLLQYDKFDISLSHVIGFSLGGQIAGRVGIYLKDSGIILPRITGSDVAAPLFYGPASYLTPSSAIKVDTIHTNSAVFGKLLPIGHVDFYVNDIVFQPQCVGLDLGELIICSHTFANEIFAESIQKDHVFCGNSLLGSTRERMGEYLSESAQGIYTVETNKQYPYAMDTQC